MARETHDSEYPTEAQMDEMWEAYQSDGKHEMLKVLQKVRQERAEASYKAATAESLTSPAEEASAPEPPARSHLEPREESD